MAVDVRQVMAAFLTLSMFVMFGNMIKRDHFDPAFVNVPAISSVRYDVVKVSKQSLAKFSPWKEDGKVLKPCWKKPSLKGRYKAEGFITFSLNGGVEHHVLQVADAVVVARQLRAMLVIPDIVGNKPGNKRKFGEIYDVQNFVTSLDGIVRVAKDRPSEVSSGKLFIVRIPNGVSEDYIAAKVEPIFRRNGKLRLATYFPSSTKKKEMQINYTKSYLPCLAMFQALKLQLGLREVASSMVEKLRTLSERSSGRFIAVDTGIEKFVDKCRESGATGQKVCYSALEIGQFLKKVGFHRDSTIYLTEIGWHNSSDALRDIYPNTYTKDNILPADKKANFLNSRSPEFGRALDFHICSKSDVFLPAYPSLFYASVVGARIANGKTRVLVPAQINSSSANDYTSQYISTKSHLAYSCFC